MKFSWRPPSGRLAAVSGKTDAGGSLAHAWETEHEQEGSENTPPCASRAHTSRADDPKRLDRVVLHPPLVQHCPSNWQG